MCFVSLWFVGVREKGRQKKAGRKVKEVCDDRCLSRTKRVPTTAWFAVLLPLEG